MIDFDNDITGAVETALEAAYPIAFLYDEPLPVDASFPCVVMEEIDNYIDQRTIDSGSNENHVVAAYEISVYSNRTRNKKQECKDIFAVVSDTLTGLGFTRLSANPTSMIDATVYRLIGRFTAVVSKEGEIYRR